MNNGSIGRYRFGDVVQWEQDGTTLMVIGNASNQDASASWGFKAIVLHEEPYSHSQREPGYIGGHWGWDTQFLELDIRRG